jgi:hypothetical protein
MGPVDVASECDASVCQEAVDSLLEALDEVPDSRMARGVRYALGPLLGLCVVAFICGRQNLTQVMRFGRDHKDLLEELGFTRKRPPSIPTLSRVLGATKTSDLQKALGRWFGSLVDSQRKRGRCAVASVDGKASRSAGIHVLNVFLHDVRQVIWQVPVETKENEISAIKQALDGLFETYPFLQILTGDAMFAGAPLCADLIKRGRHYVFQIKADQKNLYEKLDLVFAAKLAGDPKPDSLTGEKKRLRRRS